MPLRIQRKRTKGWKMPENTVYVGSGSQWENPFKVGGWFKFGDPFPEKAGIFKMIWCQSYRPQEGFTLIENNQQATDWFRHLCEVLPQDTNKLRGKNLACWCKPGEPCHGDVLLKLANLEIKLESCER